MRSLHHKNMILVLLILCLLIFSACMQDTGLQPGDPMPPLNYINMQGQTRTLSLPGDSAALIILFDLNCSCSARLNYLDKHINELNDIRIYLLTENCRLLQNPASFDWQNLYGAENCIFGCIDSLDSRRVFADKAPLCAWLFNSDGTLIRKLGKEVIISRIHRLLNRNSTKHTKG